MNGLHGCALIGPLVFTNETVGRGVQRLVEKEKKGLVQREEEFSVYDGQPAVKKARVSRTEFQCPWIVSTNSSDSVSGLFGLFELSVDVCVR